MKTNSVRISNPNIPNQTFCGIEMRSTSGRTGLSIGTGLFAVDGMNGMRKDTKLNTGEAMAN